MEEKKKQILQTNLAGAASGQYLPVKALVSFSGQQGRTIEKAERSKDWRRYRARSLTRAPCFILEEEYDRKCLFLSFSLSQQKTKDLFPLSPASPRDHLLLRTLKHKLAHPLVAAAAKKRKKKEEEKGKNRITDNAEEQFSPSVHVLQKKVQRN